MALKPCKECKKEVSDEAKVCPHCGVQWPTGKPTGCVTYVLGALFTIFVIGIVAQSISSLSPSSSAPAAKAETTESDQRGYRAAAGAATLKSMMRNPATFQLVSAVAVPHDTTCYKYRSQNGFGGMNVGEAIADGRVVETDASGTFAASWNKKCAPFAGIDVTTYTKYLLTQLPDQQ